MKEEASSNTEPITVIKPRTSAFELRLGVIWQYRELIRAFFSRDLKVRYTNTWAGWAWAILNPLINIAILSFVFGRIANVDTNGINSGLYTTVGIVGWTFFSTLLSDGSTVLLGAQQLVQKVYFPRIVLPISKVLLALFDFIIMLVIVVVSLLWHKQTISFTILCLPLAVLLTILLGLAAGLWSGALSVRYKDFRYIVPIMVRIGMFVTPIAYALSAVPVAYQHWFRLNPLVGMIELYRYSILGLAPDMIAVWYAIIFTIIGLLTGLIYFNRLDDEIADVM